MENKLYPKVFMWMAVGLLVTFLTGFIVSTNENMLLSIFGGGKYFFFIIAELAVVIFLSARIHKMKATTARICFILYSFLTGLTFSSIFVVYELESIMLIFLVAAFLFGVFAIIGYKTNIDLSKLGTILIMLLLGIIVCTVVNIFLGNETFDIIICIVSIVVFLGFVAYDIQKIKRLENSMMEEDKIAIIGALELYLDFINIFLDLLRLFGNSRD